MHGLLDDGSAYFVRIVSGDYVPSLINAPSVRMVSEVVMVSGVWAHAWVDGIDASQPALIALECLSNLHEEGTLGDYIERNIDVARAIAPVADANTSPTLFVRACEILRLEGGTPASAYATAQIWSQALLDMDELDRLALEAVASNEVLAAGGEGARPGA